VGLQLKASLGPQLGALLHAVVNRMQHAKLPSLVQVPPALRCGGAAGASRCAVQALILVFARLVNHNSAADVVEFLSGMTLPTGILALQARGVAAALTACCCATPSVLL
jgi:hypothetical protein